jgi:serine/threonine-protein kinase
MELAAGTLVTDNVRLIAPLGEGGMGSVWVADHLGLRTRVAVKFIAPELLDEDPDMVKRFRREAGAASRIKSPHVVQTLDHGMMADGTPYIVMELLEGESLADRIDRTGPLPLEKIADIVDQVARGLGKAHGAGIIHRDIKPDNVFLVGTDEDELFIKLLDFGVAKHTETPSYSVVTGTGAMIGTPGYMSPEQVLTGKDVDVRSDLWSLAVVVYHAMIGDIPFQGETLGALCVSITRGYHAPPSSLRGDVPQEVDKWTARALALDPELRFQSAKEFATTFRGAIRGLAPWADEYFAKLGGSETVVADTTLVRGASGTLVVRESPPQGGGTQRIPPVQTQARRDPATGQSGTVVLPTPAPELARMRAIPIEEVRHRPVSEPAPRSTRAGRRRWVLAIVLASLGFLAGFSIVFVTRPKQHSSVLKGSALDARIFEHPEPEQPPPEIPEPSATEPPPSASASAPPSKPVSSVVKPVSRPPPKPSTEAPTVRPAPSGPRPPAKDRGF